MAIAPDSECLMSCVSSSQVGVNPSVQSNIESQLRWIYDEAKASGLASEVGPNIEMEVHMKT